MGTLRKVVAFIFLLEGLGCYYLSTLIAMPDITGYLRSHGMQAGREVVMLEEALEYLKSVLIYGAAISLVGAVGSFAGGAWGRIVALIASVANLLFFLPAGVMGIIAFWKKDPEEIASEFHYSGSESPDAGFDKIIAMVASGVHFGLSIFLSQWLKGYLGLEPYFRQENIEGISFPLLIGCFTLFTMLHELGHLLMAWATGFRFLAINVGPFTFEKDLDGKRNFKLNLKGLFLGGGYVSAIPTSTKDLKSNWIFVVLAGPAFSLLTALFFFQLLLTKGAEGLGDWTPVALMACSVCVADAVANMLPLGKLDGGQFFNVVCNTADGKMLLALLEGAMNQGVAHSAMRSENWARTVEASTQALEALERAGKEDPAARMSSLLQLGEALLRSGEPSKALDTFEKALAAMGKNTPRNPGVLAAIHIGMGDAARLTGQHGVAANHTNEALLQLEACRENSGSWSNYAEIGVMAAKLRLLQRDYYDALEEVSKTFQLAKKNLSGSQKLTLLTVQTESLCALGRLPAAIEVWKELETDFLSPKNKKAGTADNLFALSEMTEIAWRYGAEEWAIGALGEIAKAGTLRAAKTAQLRIVLAGWLAELGRGEVALQALQLTEEQKTTLTPEWIRKAELALGAAFIEIGQAADAQAAFTRVAQSPAENMPHRTLAAESSYAAEAYWIGGQQELAVETAKKALDVLMPDESIAACRALMIYGLEVGQQSPGDEEMFFGEMVRLTANKTKGTAAERARALGSVIRRLRVLGKTQYCPGLEKAEADLRHTLNLHQPQAPEPQEEEASSEQTTA